MCGNKVIAFAWPNICTHSGILCPVYFDWIEEGHMHAFTVVLGCISHRWLRVKKGLSKLRPSGSVLKYFS